jgi:hypothetical protein
MQNLSLLKADADESDDAASPLRSFTALATTRELVPPPRKHLKVINGSSPATVTNAAPSLDHNDAHRDVEVEFPEVEAESQVYFTRDQKRSRRKRDVRARTIDMSRFAQSALELGRLLQPEVEVERPRQRTDCARIPRPCPFVSCRHHLYLDVSPRTGSIKLNFPDLEVEELKHSCSLDVAEAGALGAEELGEVMNLTRERVRQLERHGMEAIMKHLDASKT